MGHVVCIRYGIVPNVLIDLTINKYKVSPYHIFISRQRHSSSRMQTVFAGVLQRAEIVGQDHNHGQNMVNTFMIWGQSSKAARRKQSHVNGVLR